MNIQVAGFTFLSDFDSGNLGRVELVVKKPDGEDQPIEKTTALEDDTPDYEFNLWTRPDCLGTEYENGNRTWFYFGVKGGPPFSTVQLNIVDLNKQTKMFSQGMAPVVRIVPGRNHWERIKDKPNFRMKDNLFILSFKYRALENQRATTYFAFTYPFPYMELQNMLLNIDHRFKVSPEKTRKCTDLDEIYYHRECVCYSLEGRRVELITISSHHNMCKDREPRLKYLFPDSKTLRPFCFTNKKVVFVSARVHPGETPSSFVLNGLLQLLLKRDDPVAILLRKNYVFKLVPMLNPDGVYRGHYRTDTRGVNLNRVYLAPSFALHPSIYAARALILYYHHGREIDEVVVGPIFDPAARRCKVRSNPVTSEAQSTELASSIQCKNVTRFLNTIYHQSLTKPAFDVENLSSKKLIRRGSTGSDSIKLTGLLGADNCNKLEPPRSKSCPPVDNLRRTTEGEAYAQRSETSMSVGSSCSSGCGRRNLGTIGHANKLKNEQFGERTRWGGINTALAINDKKMPYTSPQDSGLFLYVDLHGHASKKGIFMYGNHFENISECIECMLMPKIMSLNSPNFHFSACNFTERNMYLRDRKDGSSREGCGRVSVLKTTGLVRSYTLECNYNTGRLVNILAPCVRDMHKPNNVLVPPKYTPQVFEEIGQALGVSVLDLTGTHPWSRIPNSEFRTLNGIREWLKGNCVSDQLFLQRPSMTPNVKHSASRRQVACVAGASMRMSRPTRSTTPASACKASRHDVKRRLLPLVSKTTKGTGMGTGSPAARAASDKSEDETSGNSLDSERKENVTSFQIISPPQSPEHVKLRRAGSDPKENVSPGSSQRFPGTSKKLSVASNAGVLKQVLIVQPKCSSVGPGAGSSKSRGSPAFKVIKTTFQRNSKAHLECQLPEVPGPVHADGTLKEGGESNSRGVVCLEKPKYFRDEVKGVVQHGSKRLKVCPLKVDHQAVGHSARKNASGQNKLTLKEIPYLNHLKEKRNVSKLSAEQKVDSSGEEAGPCEVPGKPLRQSLLLSRSSSLQKSMKESPVDDSKASTAVPKSSPKTKSGVKPEKLVKAKVPHSSPVKTLKKTPPLTRKVSGDSGKRWSKTSLRTFATSIGKLRTVLKEDAAFVEKKRKKRKERKQN